MLMLKKCETNNLNSQLRNVKEKQNKPKANKRKEIIKKRSQLN
jgi:hypothetical protein